MARDKVGRPARSAPASTRHGFGRVLIAVYAVFAVSATARAGYQLLTQYSRAPLAYWLSAVAALVYVVATVALARSSATSRRVATAAVSIELVGVVVVGAVSVADPAAFADASVWSDFGSGYGYVPLVLPVVGLLWLYLTRRSAVTPGPGPGEGPGEPSGSSRGERSG